ncbi:hypothetical protein NL676_015208 [Syzygium grande]|nr:hypothetical protein NL676_015208 [Syzygium grande]
MMRFTRSSAPGVAGAAVIKTRAYVLSLFANQRGNAKIRTNLCTTDIGTDVGPPGVDHGRQRPRQLRSKLQRRRNQSSPRAPARERCPASRPIPAPRNLGRPRDTGLPWDAGRGLAFPGQRSDPSRPFQREPRPRVSDQKRSARSRKIANALPTPRPTTHVVDSEQTKKVLAFCFSPRRLPLPSRSLALPHSLADPSTELEALHFVSVRRLISRKV